MYQCRCNIVEKLAQQHCISNIGSLESSKQDKKEFYEKIRNTNKYSSAIMNVC